jgi:hypothetical protein
MGRSFLFACPKCDYKARVSGRADDGSRFAVQTILCRDCRELYDAVTRMKVPDESRLKWRAFSGEHRLRVVGRARVSERAPTFQSALNRLPPSAARRLRWQQFSLRCPVSPFHRVQAWKDPGKCPRCGVYLEKNALPFRIWE